MSFEEIREFLELRFSEAVVLVDVAIFREQFKSMAQSYSAPDPFGQLPSLDVVHFARFTVLEDDALAAQPQPTIIHRAFHLLIHVVELQCFCHADLPL